MRITRGLPKPISPGQLGCSRMTAARLWGSNKQFVCEVTLTCIVKRLFPSVTKFHTMLTQAPVLSSDRWRIIETVFDGYVINCSEIPTKVAWNKSDLGSVFSFSLLIAVCDANFYFKFVTIFKMKIVRDFNSPSQTVNAEITHWLNGASSFTKVVNVTPFPFWLAVWQLLLLDILYVKQQRLNQRLQAPRDSNIRDKSFFFDVIRQINDLVTELQWICVYKGDSKSRKYTWGWVWQSKNEKRTISE